jgi:hypothetical protein
VPHLKELVEKHKADGLVVLGVHTTGSGEKMKDYVAEAGITWPVAVDVDNQTTTAFAVDSYPDYYVVDRAGNLRVADLQNAAVDAAVAKLLAEPADAKDVAKAKTGKPDAEALLAAALADAKKTERKVLVHVHGPG